jgi:hypothetical protein
MRRPLVLLLALMLLPTRAGAGEIPIRGLGIRVASLGDLDGDGKPEFAAANRTSSAEIVVVSTGTGKELWRTGARDAVAVPDQDGDGRPDVAIAVVGNRPDAWVSICSGKTGAFLTTIAPKGGAADRFSGDNAPYTESIALLDDAGGDGKPDFIVVRAHRTTKRPGAGIAGLLLPWCEDAAAFVLSLDGKVIAELDAKFDADWRSPLAVPAGDADGDGRTDLLVRIDSARGKLPLELRSITKGTLLAGFKGESWSMPDAIAVLGDVDGDGKADFLFGEGSAKRGESEAAGVVHVLSGKDGHEIRSVKGAKEGDHLGESVTALPDVDGDGVPDFVAGSPNSGAKKSMQFAGAVTAYSGKTGKILWTAKGDVASGCLGAAVAALPDVDGDGAADVVAGAPGFGPDEKGRVLVLSGKTGKTLLTFPK